MFKKGQKIIVSLSFIAIVVGSVLFGIGLMTGGVDQFKEQTRPEPVTKTFEEARSIALALNTKEVHIEPSPDHKVRVTYYETLGADAPVQVHVDKDKTLQVGQMYGDFNWRILTYIGQELHLPTSKDYGIVTIQLPKGQTLDKVYGRVDGRMVYTVEEIATEIFDIKISQQTIKELDLVGNVNLDRVTIDKGSLTLSTANNTITKSQLKNLTISGRGFDDEYDEYDYYEEPALQNSWVPNYNVNLDETSLENVTFTEGLVNLTGSAVSLKGDITMTSHYATIHLGLIPDSLKGTQFLLSHSPEERESDSWAEENSEKPGFNIQLPESLAKEAKTLSDTEAVREVKSPTATLTIANKGWGEIIIK